MPAQTISLSTLPAADGFVIQGHASGDEAGYSVASAGDVNGDGIDDLIVGARGGDDGGSRAGEAYIVFGTAAGFGIVTGGRQVLNLANLSPQQGFVVQGDRADDGAGWSVASAGDVNGDGIDDLLIGAGGGDDGGAAAGEAYVVFGTTGGFGAPVVSGGVTRQVLDLTSLSAAQGFIIQGDATFDYAGRSLASAGDVNGDGFDDIIVGAYGGSDGGGTAGEAYVIFGSDNSFGTSVTTGGFARQVIDLTGLTAAQGFIIQGDDAIDRAGRSVAGAGDLNGDGIADLIVGASDGNDGGDDAGEAYIIFGSSAGFGTTVSTGGFDRQVIDLTTLAGVQGFIVQGDDAADLAGRSVASAGDVNGDGIADIVIGAPLGDDGGTNSGEAYVIFGSTGGYGSDVGGRQVIDLTALSPAQGFVIQGDDGSDQLGVSVAAAGDINGDGLGDLIVGAPYGFVGGLAYVIFGSGSGFGTMVGGRQVLDISALAEDEGLILIGGGSGDLAGNSVSAAGDLNNDGIDDLVVGAWRGDETATNAGQAYVIFGRRDFGGAPPIDGTAAGETLTGTAGDDVINGLGGNDVLLGGAGADTMRGGADNDIYVVDDAGDVIEELANEGGRDRVETGLGTYTMPDNVEELEYTGSGMFSGTGNAAANSIVGGGQGDTLTGLDGDDVLGGEAGDDTLNGGNGSDRLFGGTGADIMNGEAGNDRMIVDNHGDVANGGDGIDTVEFSAVDLNYILTGDVEIVRNISGGDIFVTLNALANTYGGGIGIDRVRAGDGQDSLYGRGGDDTLQGEGGNDYLFGQEGEDGLSGGDGDDQLYGGADNDSIFAGTGNDTLYGEGGDDLLTGSTGVDQLFGGAGADLFEFFAGDSGTTLATADRIRDFSSTQGDRIQLGGIDAIAGGGDDAFSFIGSGAFTGVAGQLRAVVSGGTTLVSGDTNGDGVADFLIRIDGLHMLTAADFML